MRYADAAMITAIAERRIAGAFLITATRPDATVLRVTDHPSALTIVSQTFTPGGFTRSNLRWTLDNRIDSFEMRAVFGDVVTEADVAAGLWDGAIVDTDFATWETPSNGIVRLRRDAIGPIRIGGDSRFTAELRGAGRFLRDPVGVTCSPGCPHALGDAGCANDEIADGIDLATIKTTVTVASVTSNRVFRINETLMQLPLTPSAPAGDDYMNDGVALWNDGNNVGLRGMIEDFDESDKEITLYRSMFFDIEVGDSIDVYPGCDKQPDTCRDKFDNYDNFGGFEHMPGPDDIVAGVGSEVEE